MTEDDRASFRQQSERSAAAMAGDQMVRDLDTQLISASDRHGYSYMWTWLGVPVIQMPSDIVVMQEIIWRCRPQVIVETGLARGGSALLYASIQELLGEGVVVAVDIDIRPHNRASVVEHPLGHRVRFVEGSSTDADVLDQVRQYIGDASRVMVVLDSDHTHEHVLAELRAYAPLVSKEQYLVVADTVVEDIPPQAHRPRAWGPGDNPLTAVRQFLNENVGFEVDPQANDKLLMSSSRGGYLRRLT